MESLQQNLMLTLLILAGGTGLFVRLVAKEKHRRDKHLLARLAAKMAEAEKEHVA